ncbi:glycoprotein hormone receptor [Holotrichia oblita]|uniref:Glycoprotein hormone receptor n=1 Tax=Holotrichia oblita TaxID=644536 RepID=A0ACB9TD13_HOLOL|nr:glycoprotein hormone receptor [Holotrichia oblita]
MFRKRQSVEDDHDDETCKLDYNGDCICRHRDLLCHDKNYTKAPDNIPREFVHLMDFTGNNFKFTGPTTLENIPHHVIELYVIHIVALCPVSYTNLKLKYFMFAESLRGNLLKSVRMNFFPNIPLAMLSLMENQIEEVEVGSLAMLPTLLHLNFERNPFTTLDRNVLKPLNSLQDVYFERFEKCIAAPHVGVCYPKGDGISSYEHLIHNPILRASTNTTGGTVICVTYAFYISGFLSTLSYQSSVLIISLVTWERFISVTQPLARKQPSKKTASITLICLWIITTIVAAVPLLDLGNEYFKDFYNGNGVCLALLIQDPFHEIRKRINSCTAKRKRPCHQRYDSAYSVSFGMFPLGCGSERGLTVKLFSFY